jgi:hypothetical protein
VVLEVIVLTHVTNNTLLKAKTMEKAIKITTLTVEEDSGRSSESTKRIEFNNSRINNNNTCDN